MEEVDVPSFFLCPISLQIMRDPVTVSTGITYDRESIETWLFSGRNTTCPVTKQVLTADSDLTPNHTLRRLIQSWCILNAIERIPTPKPPINKIQILKLINEAKRPSLQLQSLQTLKSLASESEANKRCIESAGAVEFLASVITSNDNNTSTATFEEESSDFITASGEALTILYSLHISESSLNKLLTQNEKFVHSLIRMMESGAYQSRVYALLLFKSIFDVVDPMQIISLTPNFFVEVVQLMHDQISHQATKAALKLLVQICPWGRNRIKAAEAGAVSVLIELLLDTPEKRVCELILMVLDLLCGCPEGRSELVKHGAGLPVVSKKILRVSQVASERAVRVLWSIARFSASPRVLQEMSQVGVVKKLCLVLQVDCASKTKEKAREILKLHARVWNNTSCIPATLLSSYPL